MKKIIISVVIILLILISGIVTFFCINQNKKHEEVKSELVEDLASDNDQDGTIIFNIDKQIINNYNYVIYVKENSDDSEKVIVSIYQIDENNELKLKKSKEYTLEEWEKIKNSEEYRKADAKFSSSNEDKLKEECFRVRGISNDYYIYYENIKDILNVLDYKID